LYTDDVELYMNVWCVDCCHMTLQSEQLDKVVKWSAELQQLPAAYSECLDLSGRKQTSSIVCTVNSHCLENVYQKYDPGIIVDSKLKFSELFGKVVWVRRW